MFSPINKHFPLSNSYSLLPSYCSLHLGKTLDLLRIALIVLRNGRLNYIEQVELENRWQVTNTYPRRWRSWRDC